MERGRSLNTLPVHPCHSANNLFTSFWVGRNMVSDRKRSCRGKKREKEAFLRCYAVSCSFSRDAWFIFSSVMAKKSMAGGGWL